MNILVSILNFIYAIDEYLKGKEANFWDAIFHGDFKVFGTGEVKGYKIYFRQLGIYFEYLLIIDGEIYTFGQNIKPRTLRAIGHLFLRKRLYSKSELSGIIALLKMQAGATIENHIK